MESEADFQRNVVELAHLLGWRVLHVRKSIGKRGGKAGWQTTTSIKGWPDLFLFHPKKGQTLALELKSETGKPTAEQLEVLSDLAKAGIRSAWVRPSNWDKVQAWLEGNDDGQ